MIVTMVIEEQHTTRLIRSGEKTSAKVSWEIVIGFKKEGGVFLGKLCGVPRMDQYIVTLGAFSTYIMKSKPELV